jgi:hypothetical protein
MLNIAKPEVPARTLVLSALFLIIGLLVLLFVIFQARYLIIGPQITLTEAPGGPQNSRQVFFAGNAKNISHLWLNNRQIYTDPQGNFKEAVILEDGYTVTTLRAQDRYGRTTTIERVVVYAPVSFVQ